MSQSAREGGLMDAGERGAEVKEERCRVLLLHSAGEGSFLDVNHVGQDGPAGQKAPLLRADPLRQKGFPAVAVSAGQDPVARVHYAKWSS